MSPPAARRPGGPSMLLSGPSVALMVVASAVLVLGGLWALDLLDVSTLGSKKPSHEGMVGIPTVAAGVPVYTRLTRDHFWDRTNGRLAVVYLPPQAVTPEMIGKFGDIIGRVLSHDKSAGYVFTETDLLPKGTREGIVAGIPAGKRAVRIAADKADGLFGLHVGDRFDLLATMPIEGGRGDGQGFSFAGVYGQQIGLQARLSNWQKQATVRVMVQNGVIVEPMNTRTVPMFQSSLTEGGTTRMRPVQEAVIAVDPDEVARLTEALAVGAKITAIPRSGRPDDRVDSRTPDLSPVSPFADALSTAVPGASPDAPGPGAGAFRIVETIMGQKRELTAVPRH